MHYPAFTTSNSLDKQGKAFYKLCTLDGHIYSMTKQSIAPLQEETLKESSDQNLSSFLHDSSRLKS